MVGTALIGSACSGNETVTAQGTASFDSGDGGLSHVEAGDGGIPPGALEEGPCEQLYQIVSCRVYYDSANPDINNCFVGQQVCWIDDAGDQVWTICIEPARVNERIAESATRTPSPE